MDRDTALELLSRVTDDRRELADGVQKLLQTIELVRNALAPFQPAFEEIEQPEHFSPDDVTDETLAGWQLSLDGLARVVRDAEDCLTDDNMYRLSNLAERAADHLLST
jgi:hypothetical protein